MRSPCRRPSGEDRSLWRERTARGCLHSQEPIPDIDPAPYSCHPCLSQIGIDIIAPGAAHGTLTYGNESDQTGGGFLDTEGILVLFVQGAPILLPAPLAIGEIRSFSAPFTASGRVIPPPIPGDGLMNTLTGSGVATVTLSGGPGDR